jgi:hypothetical protein
MTRRVKDIFTSAPGFTVHYFVHKVGNTFGAITPAQMPRAILETGKFPGIAQQRPQALYQFSLRYQASDPMAFKKTHIEPLLPSQ